MLMPRPKWVFAMNYNQRGDRCTDRLQMYVWQKWVFKYFFHCTTTFGLLNDLKFSFSFLIDKLYQIYEFTLKYY